ncbi:hypothetical protein BH09BAC2_BH09BAC2_02400 [soil metagenome]
MVLIYAKATSPRLQYIASFIFKDILQVAYAITTHEEGFKGFDGIRLNYSHQSITDKEICIPDSGLLFETDIQPRDLNISEYNGERILFASSTSDDHYPHDIFSACFYLISRYEEYLTYEKDKYGRYPVTNSVAFKEGFINKPQVQIWIRQFADFLKKYDNRFEPAYTDFSFKPTYNIDVAYSFKNKGIIRNAAGAVRSLFTFKIGEFVNRMRVMAFQEKDPSDNYEWLHKLHTLKSLSPVYFFLPAQMNSLSDRNILSSEKAMAHLIQIHASKYNIGLNLSWRSNEDPSLLKTEKDLLEKIAGTNIFRSRQHYLKISLPYTYRNLIDAGIKEDYTMGYGHTNGFRASLACSFLWYDLLKDEQTKLKVFPFCYMDSTVIFGQKLTPEQGLKEINYYYNICKEYNGTFIPVFHNHFLGDDMAGWKKMYEQFIQDL